MPWSGTPPDQTFSRTDGISSGTDTWQQAAGALRNIEPDDHDTHDQDVATGLNAVLKKDGGNAATADIPFGGFAPTNVREAAARTEFARFSQLQDNKGEYCATVGGTADVITLTPSPAFTAYVAGQRHSFVASGTNTGATTVNVSGLGAKDIRRNDGSHTALSAADIASGQIVDIEYDGTRFHLLSDLPVDEAAAGAPVLVPAVEFRTGSATITIPTGATKCKVTLQGGGGGGGSGVAAGCCLALGISSGGGGGGTLYKYLSGLTPGNTLVLTIGAAGSGAGGTNTNGGAGGNSTLASGTQSITTLTANGGSGGDGAGTGQVGNIVSGGTCTNGDFNIQGQSGTASGEGINIMSMGGSSLFGHGGLQNSPASGAAAGVGFGGGGSGHDGAGANGTAGCAVFEWYA